MPKTDTKGGYEYVVWQMIQQFELVEETNALGNDQLLGIEALHKLLEELAPALLGNSGKLTEFQALQDQYEYNIVNLLLSTYKQLKSNDATDTENVSNQENILLMNKLLQGLLLIHPNSRKIFSKKDNMMLMISFIQNSGNETPTVVISFISTLVHILLKNLDNFRAFEKCGGCAAIIKHFNLQALQTTANTNPKQQELNFKIIEFLLFYFVDENEVSFDHSTTPFAKKLSIDDKASFFREKFPGIDGLIINLNDLKSL